MAASSSPRGQLLRTTELGQEKFCRRCSEWWPADREFWYPSRDGVLGLFYCCKACYAENDKRPGRTGAKRAAELQA